MIREEVHALLHNKLLMFVLFAIMLIPAMYAGLFLASMWDPYGDLGYLPVAVVNNDKKVTYNDKELTIGEDLANNLKDNDSMAFNVVDAETAKDGLENGTYYMVVTIPEDFSENASTLMDDTPKKMVLDYETNPGKNYISMKLSESAMKEIKANLTEEITKTYAETVFDSLKDIEDGFQDAVDGTDEMLDGEDKLVDGNKKITDNLDLLASSTVTFKEGTDTLSSGLKTYTDGVATVDKGIATLQKGTKSLSTDAVGGSKQLSDGASTLDKGVKTYTEGVATAKAGADQLVANNDSLNKGVATLSAGVSQLKKQGTEALLAGLKQMQGKLGTTVTDANQTKIQTASAGMVQLNNGIQQLNTAVAGADTSALSNLSTGLTSVGGNVQTAGTKLVAAGNNLNDAGTNLQNIAVFASGISDATLKAQILAEVNSASTNVISAGTNVSSAGNELATAGSTLGTIKTTMENANLAGTLSQLSTNLSTIATNADLLLPAASVKLTEMYGGLSDVKTALDTQLVPGMETVNSNMGTIQTSIDQSLMTGVKTYTDGVATLSNGLNTLSANNKDLQTGASSLATGANTLYTGLDSGVKQLSEGVVKLKNGTGKLVSNNATITSGASKLSDGASKISDGATKLRDGSGELGDGLLELRDGTNELHDGLKDGKDEIADNEASDGTVDMFAAPVEVNETKITDVENNGHAMAAYMFSVGLWVGCLAFCLMYPLARYTGKLTSGRAWWASKAVVLYPMSILMVVLLLGILHVTVGFNPASMFETFVVGLATVAAFMSIMYFFNLLLGKVGSFMMLLFMVLQLAGSAGTYPVEISGSLANALHKWVPFTYSVDGFRAAIAQNGPSIVPECVVLFGISIAFTLLTILVFRVRAKRTLENKPFIYEWIEEKGLA